VISLRKLLVEQLVHSIDSDEDIDSDIESFGVDLVSKDVKDGAYTYVVSGDPDAILRLVLHVSGPKGIRQDRTVITPQSFGGCSDDWGVW
jgi:hypothetical protein